MGNISNLVYIIRSLRNRENRKIFVTVLGGYIGIITRKKSSQLPMSTDTPYKPEIVNQDVSHNILLVLHQFSRTGAPYAVLYLARALFSIYGRRPVIISPEDGEVREEFEKEGFQTIVDPQLFSYKKFQRDAYKFVEGFERVIVTPLASFDFIRCFRQDSPMLQV